MPNAYWQDDVRSQEAAAILADLVGLGEIMEAGLASEDGAAALASSQVTSSGGATARTVSAKLGDSLSVKDFGAAGDDSTDDTDAIHEAIDAVKDVGGGRLWFPPGRYRHSGIDADVDDLEIEGPGATLVCTLSKTFDKSSVWLRGDRLTVRDIAIDFATPLTFVDADGGTPGYVAAADLLARPANAYGLRIGGRRDASGGEPGPYIASDIRVERVTVRNARNGGISVYKASRAIVQGCTVLRTLGNGIGFDGCVDVIQALGNRCEYMGDDLLVIVTDDTVPGGTVCAILQGNILRYGYAKGLASTGVDKLVATGNVIEWTWAQGIAPITDLTFSLGPSYSVLVADNIVNHAGKYFGTGQFKTAAGGSPYSVNVSSGTERVKVRNNLLMDGQSRAISVSTTEDLDISGNTIRDHLGPAIVAGDTDGGGFTSLLGARICDNDIDGVAGGGISVGGGTGVIVTGNKVKSYDGGSAGETRGIYYGYLDSSLIANNTIINDDGGNYGLRANPSSTNPRTKALNNFYTTGADGFLKNESPDHLIVKVKSAQYYAPLSTGGTGTAVLTKDIAYAAPIQLGRSGTITAIGLEVTSAGEAGSLVRLSIYDDNGGDPGTLLLDAGTIAGDGATGFKEITGLTLAVAAGQYWLVAVTQNVVTTAPTIRTQAGPSIGMSPDPSSGGNSAWRQTSGVTGAMPATFTNNGKGAPSPRVHIKVT